MGAAPWWLPSVGCIRTSPSRSRSGCSTRRATTCCSVTPDCRRSATARSSASARTASASSRSTSGSTSGSTSPRGVLAAALAGALVAAFISHRRGIYYALLTIAFGQLAWFIAIKWHSVTGGEDGLLNLKRPPLDLGVLQLSIASNEAFFLFVLVLLVVVVLGCWRFVHSPAGRVLACIRQNEMRARFLGYRVWAFKFGVFVLSTAIAGLAGALFAMAQQGAYPNVMSLHQSGLRRDDGAGRRRARELLGSAGRRGVLHPRTRPARRVHRDLAALVRAPVHGDRPLEARGARGDRARAGGAPQGRDDAAVRGHQAAQALRRPRRARGREPCVRCRHDDRHHGTERRRQDDVLQRADRSLRSRPRPCRHGRRRHHRARPAGDHAARRRPVVPVDQPVRPGDGAGQRRHRAAAHACARARRVARPGARHPCAGRGRGAARAGRIARSRANARARPVVRRAPGARDRARAGHAAADPVPRRADVGPRRRRHRAARGAHRRAEAPLHDRHHRARHALPVRARRPHPRHPLGPGDRVGHAGRAARQRVGRAARRWDKP